MHQSSTHHYYILLLYCPLQVAQLTDEFFLLGTLCGMALYNQCLMNIPFPLALFKKLLGLKPTLDDLMELSPTVAQYFYSILHITCRAII